MTVPPNAQSTPLVLVADDDMRTARMLASLLRADGFDVEVVGAGAAAMCRLARAPLPDLLVSDLTMPLYGGIALARFARAQRAGVPVVFVTGHPQHVARALAGMSPPPIVFVKPLEYDGFAKALRELLFGADGTSIEPAFATEGCEEKTG